MISSVAISRFPEVSPICAMRSHSRFSSFLAGSFDTWVILCFLTFFWLFPLSCLNPSLTVLHTSGIPIQLSFYAGNSSIFWSGLLFFFSFFFSHKLPGLSSLCFLGFKPFGFTISSLFPWPLVLISLGLSAVIFWTSTNVFT